MAADRISVRSAFFSMDAAYHIFVSKKRIRKHDFFRSTEAGKYHYSAVKQHKNFLIPYFQVILSGRLCMELLKSLFRNSVHNKKADMAFSLKTLSALSKLIIDC